MPVTWQDLKSEVRPETWDAITYGLDEAGLGEKFLVRARAWLSALFKRCPDVDYSPELEDSDAIVRQAVIYRALYELYAYAEKEEVAADKKEEAYSLVKSAYPCVAGAESEEDAFSLPVGYVKEGSDNWEGF